MMYRATITITVENFYAPSEADARVMIDNYVDDLVGVDGTLEVDTVSIDYEPDDNLPLDNY